MVSESLVDIQRLATRLDEATSKDPELQKKLEAALPHLKAFLAEANAVDAAKKSVRFATTT